MNTYQKFVKVYDFDTRIVSEIPKVELAPGMVYAKVDGVGEVWVAQEKIKPGRIKHASLPQEFLEFASKVYDGFAVRDGKRSGNLTQMSRQQWLDGFRRDDNPERELMVWISILNFYKFARQRHGVGKSLEWLQDLFSVSVLAHNGGGDAAPETFQPKTMSRLEMQALLEVYRQNATKPGDETQEAAPATPLTAAEGDNAAPLDDEDSESDSAESDDLIERTPESEAAFEAWLQEYRPLYTDGEKWDGGDWSLGAHLINDCDAMRAVEALPEEVCWTLVEGEHGEVFLAGRHRGYGYVVTEKPWSDPDMEVPN